MSTNFATKSHGLISLRSHQLIYPRAPNSLPPQNVHTSTPMSTNFATPSPPPLPLHPFLCTSSSLHPSLCASPVSGQQVGFSCHAGRSNAASDRLREARLCRPLCPWRRGVRSSKGLVRSERADVRSERAGVRRGEGGSAEAGMASSRCSQSSAGCMTPPLPAQADKKGHSESGELHSKWEGAPSCRFWATKAQVPMLARVTPLSQAGSGTTLLKLLKMVTVGLKALGSNQVETIISDFKNR